MPEFGNVSEPLHVTAPKIGGGRSFEGPLTVTVGGTGPSDGISEVPDAALSRTDFPGDLMRAAFNCPPPPMPDFGA